MTDKQPEALRLADVAHRFGLGKDVAVELRRLHEVNAELVVALKKCEIHGSGYSKSEESYLPPYVLDTVRAALAKAEGK